MVFHRAQLSHPPIQWYAETFISQVSAFLFRISPKVRHVEFL